MTSPALAWLATANSWVAQRSRRWVAATSTGRVGARVLMRACIRACRWCCALANCRMSLSVTGDGATHWPQVAGSSAAHWAISR